MKRFLNGFLAFMLLVTPAVSPAAENPFKISEDLDKSLHQGLFHLYNLEFEKAAKVFDGIKSQAPEHPMVAFGMASMEWWRLSVGVLETDREESKKFLEYVDDCLKYSKAKIDAGDPTGEGYLTMGGAMGLLGRWKATNNDYGSAYFTGKKAIKHLRKALKVNPEMKDANMGLGIFDYYVATLPAVVRVLAFLGSGADPKVGIQELRVAAYEGTYARTPSKLFLAEIYSTGEKNLEKALEVLNDLRVEYPNSPFIHMMYVIAYFNHDKKTELTEEGKLFVDRVQQGIYTPRFETQARFCYGASFFKARQWAEAIKQYDLAIAAGTAKDPFFTWSHLYRGYAQDALGNREEALKMYAMVQKHLRRWSSWEQSKKYSKNPYKGTDEELKKLKL